jgi:hypothetical protein
LRAPVATTQKSASATPLCVEDSSPATALNSQHARFSIAAPAFSARSSNIRFRSSRE